VSIINDSDYLITQLFEYSLMNRKLTEQLLF